MSAADQSNRACVWVGPKSLEIQQRPVREVGECDVLIKVIATGICGSDIHNWISSSLSKQLVLGHESAGVIEKVGSKVSDRHVGQRVAIEPGLFCKACEFCKRGRPNVCSKLQYCGLDPTDGTLVQYYTCPGRLTVPIPDSISWEEAGSIQPLAIAIQVAKRASLESEHTVAIFGCGPLGLLVLAVCKAYDVKRIVVFDIEQSRVDFAISYGAHIGIVPPKCPLGTDPLEFASWYARDVIATYDLGSGFDVAIEASGAEVCTQMAICMLKNGGTCVQAGLTKPLASVPLFLVTANELNITGTVRYTEGCFEKAIELLHSRKIDLTPLISNIFPLTRANDAFASMHARQGIKFIIMNQE